MIIMLLRKMLKKVPTLHIIQQVLNGINHLYSWIVKGNQQGFEESCLENAIFLIDDDFTITYEKPPNEHISRDVKTKDDNT